MSFIADNPMVGGMAGMLGHAQMVAMMGEVVKAGDQPLLSQDNQVRILVNVRGAVSGTKRGKGRYAALGA